ncbi:hypothetical protein O5O45_00800 [Hahella aquimaris]|uniref:hypothetical protein n=1 Tax=Hahella sp. HNIBRBA332 TaxID=3015983 RepID=UPI00273C75C3|nr:hypothetical protein [Hahella sp. HNIBRBA332]WLQ14474.1 hypothetical protein O5O45_00800 [Hahella sp. HNIBRBA332]
MSVKDLEAIIAEERQSPNEIDSGVQQCKLSNASTAIPKISSPPPMELTPTRTPLPSQLEGFGKIPANDPRWATSLRGIASAFGRVVSTTAGVVAGVLITDNSVFTQEWSEGDISYAYNEDDFTLIGTDANGTATQYKVYPDGEIWSQDGVIVGIADEYGKIFPVDPQDDVNYRMWVANGGEDSFEVWKAMGRPTEGDHKLTDKPRTSIQSKASFADRANLVRSNPLISGDEKALEKMLQEAGNEDPGATGELEAIERWISSNKTVVVLKETQNQVINTTPVKNPDYRVDNEITEIKTRDEALNDRYIKDQISKANKQIKASGLNETGAVEIQLRGEAAKDVDLEDIERQVKGNFNSNRASSLHRVSVYSNNNLIAEWTRQSDKTVTRKYP